MRAIEVSEFGDRNVLSVVDRDVPEPDRRTVDHIAVSVDDVDAKTEEMVEETGCTVADGPMTMDAPNARVSFLEGPDGYVVELVES